ncbi:hypothetical protein CO033_02040 [Candidatus Nomurabacteria bacterium CG_4_9_14_0_2_um_filter_32_10]|uniref:Uncharacterized protein n=1 Tax=Candidatus Nomurabacteria bacterium CG_4_9_14_0_2_um_filter_32_10 TaxID=1974729 RepID=A0A2J0N375_9BACT|nr:MAG: hypothetical protein CO033_02040 [Candidatus Nomurabacteria bacterium CG_4_9_14_0_2_um_filter_32_10]
MNNNIENLNKPSDGEIEKQKLSEKEKILFAKVDLGLDNIKLGKYSYKELPDPDGNGSEVMKLLEERGLLEVFEKFKKRKFPFLPIRKEEVKAEFDKLARLILMEADKL